MRAFRRAGQSRTIGIVCVQNPRAARAAVEPADARHHQIGEDEVGWVAAHGSIARSLSGAVSTLQCRVSRRSSIVRMLGVVVHDQHTAGVVVT